MIKVRLPVRLVDEPQVEGPRPLVRGGGRDPEMEPVEPAPSMPIMGPQ